MGKFRTRAMLNAEFDLRHTQVKGGERVAVAF